MKFLSFLFFACAALLSLVIVDGANWPNPGRKLKCWPEVLTFSKFNMGVEFASKQKKDVLATSMDDFKNGKIDFDPKRRTAVIIHGLSGKNHADLMKLLRDAFLDWQDMNVIILHWEIGSLNPILYHFAAVNTEFASLELSSFLNNLAQYFKQEKNIDRSQWGPLHLIGYSIGVHVAGQTAAFLKRDYNWLVSRVTGLDPAEPCFEDAGNPLRLNHTNAEFVDIIHTDGARFRNGAFGILEPMGHVDFYVNGGSLQPGCKQVIKTNLPSQNPNPQYPNYLQLIVHTVLDQVCSHERSVWLFIESLKQANSSNCKFWAHPWQYNANIEKSSSIVQDKCKGNSCPQSDNTLESGRSGTTAGENQVVLQSTCDASTCPQLGINAEDYDYPNPLNTFYVATTDKQPYCNIR